MERLQGFEVAPARERGLKSRTISDTDLEQLGRSREGAWIEIALSMRRFWRR